MKIKYKYHKPNYWYAIINSPMCTEVSVIWSEVLFLIRVAHILVIRAMANVGHDSPAKQDNISVILLQCWKMAI